MADVSAPGRRPLLSRLDWPWVLVGMIPVLLALIDPPAAGPVMQDAIRALAGTAPFILFAVAAIGVLKATGSEALLARAFQGREGRMVMVAALAGGLSPFCSCEVIPFIAALLAAGTPLSAVMAFWISSPLMDPAMFAITAGAIGPEFAVGKTVIAVLLGLAGGGVVMALGSARLFADPLRVVERKGCGCGPFPARPSGGSGPRRPAGRSSAARPGPTLSSW